MVLFWQVDLEQLCNDSLTEDVDNKHSSSPELKGEDWAVAVILFKWQQLASEYIQY